MNPDNINALRNNRINGIFAWNMLVVTCSYSEQLKKHSHQIKAVAPHWYPIRAILQTVALVAVVPYPFHPPVDQL